MRGLTAFGVALMAGLVLTPVAVRVGRSLSLLDRPGPLKIHREALPQTGGPVVVIAAIGAAWAVGAGVPPVIPVAMFLTAAIGLADDAVNLLPSVRVALLLGVGVLLATQGLRVGALGTFDWISVPLLVLACANASNILDGQDGLWAGLTAAAALGLALLAGPSSWPGILGLALAGACLAFLAFNRPPARIFLGGSGAYAAGLALAVLAASVSTSRGWSGLLGAGVCLGAFAFELSATVVRRIGAGRRLVRGDRDHSYDVLAARGVSRPRVTAVFVAVGIGLAAAGIGIGSLPVGWAWAAALTVAALGIATAWILWRAPSRSPQGAP